MNRAAIGVDPSSATQLLGQQIRQARYDRGWRQVDLAAAMTDAGRKMTQQAVALVERGERRASMDELVALAQVLGVTLAWLVEPLESSTPTDTTAEGSRSFQGAATLRETAALLLRLADGLESMTGVES